MKYYLDLHLHSKFSRAVSSDMDLEHMEEAAKRKGIQILGTGDFTHPQWFAGIKNKLKEFAPGVYKLSADSPISYLLSGEISCIYTQGTKVRKIHLLVLPSSVPAAEKINLVLSWIGNLKSDGRPILGTDVKTLSSDIWRADPNALIIPAHAWTPWFSLYGANSGFDSIKEAFGELADRIYALETGLSCYDRKTEVLTNNGWKKFTEVNYKDEICTLNLKNEKVEFQKPIKIFSYKYRGKMYKLKTKRVDLLVTPNHKLLVSHCDFRKPPKFSLKKADFLFNRSKRFKKNGLWIGKNVKYFVLPAVKMKHGSRYYSGFRDKKEKRFPIKSWLKFFGFWIAEGWTNEGKNGDYNVFLCNKNNILLSEMKKILESFGYDIYWEKKVNNTIRVRDYQLFYYLKQFGKCSDKFIPSEIKSLSKELLEIFFGYYIKGDGHIYGRNRKGLSATTTSIRLRDDLQEIALKMGLSAYYKLGYKKGTPFRSPGQNYKKVYKQREDAWVVYFIRKNIHTVLPSIVKKHNYIESWVDFNGKVFSIAVPNHVIYVRRNGVPLWCGNSDPEMNWRVPEIRSKVLVSNSDAHSPDKIGRELTVVETNEPFTFPLLAQILKEGYQSPKGKISTVEFYPEEGKYHYDGHRNCGVCSAPEETKKANYLCSKCGRPLTVGVLHRVEKLSNFGPPRAPLGASFLYAVPLKELIGQIENVGAISKKVEEIYQKIIAQIPEIQFLLEAGEADLAKVGGQDLSQAVLAMREGRVERIPGYDGEYGKIKVKIEPGEATQASLF